MAIGPIGLLHVVWIAVLALVVAAGAGCGNDAPEFGQPQDVPGTYYVSNQGDDDADGLDEGTAYRTIARALEEAGPGDTVLIQAGTYNEDLMLEGIGGPASPITIRGEGNGAILDGEGRLSIGFWCERCSNLIFEKLEIRNFTDVGIGVTLSSGITMRDLRVHDNGTNPQLMDWEIEGYGIHAEESGDVTIEDNDVYRNGPQPRTPGRLGTGIDTFALTDSVIRGNRSHNNTGGGILVEDGVQIVVEENEVVANYLDASVDEWWDGGLWLDGGHDVMVRDNVFMHNEGPGIQISDEDHGQPYGYVLEGNTVTGNYYGVYIWNFGTSDVPPEDVLRMSNNEVSANDRLQMWIVPWECPPPDPCE